LKTIIALAGAHSVEVENQSTDSHLCICILSSLLFEPEIEPRILKNEERVQSYVILTVRSIRTGRWENSWGVTVLPTKCLLDSTAGWQEHLG